MSFFLVSLGGNGGLRREQGGDFGNDLTCVLEWRLCVDRKQVSFYLCILTQPRAILNTWEMSILVSLFDCLLCVRGLQSLPALC